MVHNNQECLRKYWATCSSIRSFARTAQSFAGSVAGSVTHSRARGKKTVFLPRKWMRQFYPISTLIVPLAAFRRTSSSSSVTNRIRSSNATPPTSSTPPKSPSRTPSAAAARCRSPRSAAARSRWRWTTSSNPARRRRLKVKACRCRKSPRKEAIWWWTLISSFPIKSPLARRRSSETRYLIEGGSCRDSNSFSILQSFLNRFFSQPTRPLPPFQASHIMIANVVYVINLFLNTEFWSSIFCFLCLGWKLFVPILILAGLPW